MQKLWQDLLRKSSFLPKRARKTTRVTEFIVDRLITKQSMKDIAKDDDISANTVSNYYHH